MVPCDAAAPDRVGKRRKGGIWRLERRVWMIGLNPLLMRPRTGSGAPRTTKGIELPF